MKSERTSKLIAIEKMRCMGKKGVKRENNSKGRRLRKGETEERKEKVKGNGRKSRRAKGKEGIEGIMEGAEGISGNMEQSRISEGTEGGVKIIYMYTPSTMQFYSDLREMNYI
jgi:hypothetical protein